MTIYGLNMIKNNQNAQKAVERGMIACYIVNKRKDLPTFGRTEKEETSEAEETRQLLTGLLSGVSRKIQGEKERSEEL